MYPETESIRPSSLARRSFSIRSLGRLIPSFSVPDILRLYRSPRRALNTNGNVARAFQAGLHSQPESAKQDGWHSPFESDNAKAGSGR
jgi:hypothetical protein